MKDYDFYLDLSRGSTLTLEDADSILKKINMCVASIKAEDKMDFYNDLLKKAFEYTSIRCSWELMDREEKIDNDNFRTGCHNSFITSIDVLSRLAAAEDVDSSWREDLGDDRKRIGDFACYITYINGIANR